MCMPQQNINLGASANDGTGTPIRDAFEYTNNNFTQLFARANAVPPISSIGKAGDVPGMYAYDPVYFYYCFGTYDGINAIWRRVSGSSF